MKCKIVSFFFVIALVSTALFSAQPVRQDVVEFLRPKLNSDRIQHFFGSYGIDPLTIDSNEFPGSRIANLYSIHNGTRVMRTLAIVDYANPVNPKLTKEHEAIINGQSIGITLREGGWSIDKIPVFFGEISLSSPLRGWMQEEEEEGATGSVHIYHLHVSKDSSESIPYCTIIEIHSPQYLDTKWLQALYDEQYEQYSRYYPEVEEILKKIDSLLISFPKCA